MQRFAWIRNSSSILTCSNRNFKSSGLTRYLRKMTAFLQFPISRRIRWCRREGLCWVTQIFSVLMYSIRNSSFILLNEIAIATLGFLIETSREWPLTPPSNVHSSAYPFWSSTRNESFSVSTCTSFTRIRCVWMAYFILRDSFERWYLKKDN